MFENLLTCKCLIIILIIALIIVLYLYSRKKSCQVTEGMHTVEHPWARDGETKYKSVEDWHSNKIHHEYQPIKPKHSSRKKHKYQEISSSSDFDEEEGYPQPMDPRPDLAQCQKRYQCPPCKCDGDGDGNEHDFDKEFRKIRKLKKMRREKN